MKALFSLVALLVVLGLTGLLVKKQLGSASAPTVAGTPAPGSSGSTTPTNQVQQVGQQVESLMQQPRPQSPDQ
jgi:ABC-type phosphate transport system substrate-binding protein